MDDCFASTWAYSHGPLVDPVSRLHHQHTSSIRTAPQQTHHQHQLHEQQQLSTESILDVHEHSQLIGYTSTNSSATSIDITSINSPTTNPNSHQQYQQQHYDESIILPLPLPANSPVHIPHISYGNNSVESYAAHLDLDHSQNQSRPNQNSLHETCHSSILESFVSSINTQQQVQNSNYGGATGNGINYDCRSQSAISTAVFGEENHNHRDKNTEPVDLDNITQSLDDTDHLDFPQFFSHVTANVTDQSHDGLGSIQPEDDLDELEQGDLTDLSGNFDINHPSVSTTDYLLDEDDEDVDEEEDAEEIDDPDGESEGNGAPVKDLLAFKGKARNFDTEIATGKKQGELKCRFCGFVCCSKSSLGIHERRHTGEKPYSCKYCGRLFNSAQCCKHHERLHTGDKPFECAYCGKKYAVSTRLKRHERVHTREEPYKCQECGKTFRWFDAFRDHRNTHNGVPLYLCSVCGKSFTSYLKFYYHERGHFQKKEKERSIRALVDPEATVKLGKKGKISGTNPKKFIAKKIPKKTG